MSGSKPRLKVAIKPVDGGSPIQILAAWEREGGKLSASLDKGIEMLGGKLSDGSTFRITRGANGKWSHYVNVYDNGSDGSGGGYGAPKPKRDVFGGNDDDLPF